METIQISITKTKATNSFKDIGTYFITTDQAQKYALICLERLKSVRLKLIELTILSSKLSITMKFSILL